MSLQDVIPLALFYPAQSMYQCQRLADWPQWDRQAGNNALQLQLPACDRHMYAPLPGLDAAMHMISAAADNDNLLQRQIACCCT